jgi:hydroxymethylpyrimidine pyrophosphatase-like HAD family hydrolase
MQAMNDPVFVFDLDGVITRPTDSSIDMDAVEYIYRLLENGTYVAVNTGRSFEWVASNFLSSLEKMGGLSMPSHLFMVCEKGGDSIVWIDGKFQPQPSRFALPTQAYEVARRIYEGNKTNLSTMLWDASKATMATIEKRPEASLDEFRSEQQFLAAQLQNAFTGQDVRVDYTTIAIDVELSEAGKHAGAELIYQWIVLQLGTAPKAFVSFGDSKSDYEMAKYFAQQQADSTFVFVGAKTETFTEDSGVKILKTKAAYAAGTREYFEN